MRLVTLVAALLALSTATAFAEAVRSIAMEPGDSMPLDFPSGSTVKVSRKGIVDIFALSETTWQLTALRGGLVIVDAYDTTGAPVLPRLFIDVKSKNEPERQAVTLGTPAWICKHKGVACPDGSGLVQGTSTDYRWFLHAKGWCGRANQCAWHVSLSSDAVSGLTAFLTNLLPGYDVQISAEGGISVEAPCDGINYDEHTRTIENAIPRAISDKVIAFRCSGDQDSYRIMIRAKKVSAAKGETIGYDGQLSHQVSAPPIFSSLTARAALKADAVASKNETVGEPAFIATGRREFQTLIGGELPYMTSSEHQDKTYQWKEYGLSIKGQLQGTITSKGRPSVRGAFEIFLKTINEKAVGGLLTSSLKTNAALGIGRWTLLGELDLTSDMDGLRSVPFLSAIPLIGPLFRSTTTAHSRSKLQVWAHAEPINSSK